MIGKKIDVRDFYILNRKLRGRLSGELITDGSDLYISNGNLWGRLCGEFITVNIDDSPVKEKVWSSKTMLLIVRKRLRFRRGALSDFFFCSSDGITYEDANRFTLIVDMTQFTWVPSLTPTRRTSRRVGNGTAITMRTISLSVRMLTIKNVFL